MRPRSGMHYLWIRKGVALLGLLLAISLPDVFALQARQGWAKMRPYLFLLLLDGCLVFYNRIWLERQLERDKRREYVGWLLLFMVVGSLNMSLILPYLYGQAWPGPVLVKY